MSLPGGDNRRRTAATLKLVLMGAAGAALLYSCTAGLGGGLGALPYLWFFHNPFYRGPMMSTPGSSTPMTATPPGSTASQRGGFGGSAGESTGTGTS
jgi:hypothetical protein